MVLETRLRSLSFLAASLVVLAFLGGAALALNSDGDEINEGTGSDLEC